MSGVDKDSFGTTVWPTEVRLREKGTELRVSFEDGSVYDLSAELLRVESPSAEVQGHGAGQKTIVPGKAKVTVTAVEPVGHYAVRLSFDDGHDTGIFSWSYLRKLGVERDKLWRNYLAALALGGQSRE